MTHAQIEYGIILNDSNFAKVTLNFRVLIMLTEAL